jgi:signal transduction histidine kinase
MHSLKEILQRCHRSFSSTGYAQQVVDELRDETESRICIWCDADLEPIAMTDGAQSYLKQVQAFCANLRREDGMIAAIGVVFRQQTVSYLAVAGSANGYAAEQLELLVGVGKPVWLQYQALKAQEEAGSALEAQTLATLTHELRQPLCSIEACAYYLGMTVIQENDPGRQQIDMIMDEVERANGILTKALEATQGTERKAMTATSTL